MGVEPWGAVRRKVLAVRGRKMARRYEHLKEGMVASRTPWPTEARGYSAQPTRTYVGGATGGQGFGV